MVDVSKPLPLEGIRVADFTWIVAGPQATRILADLGAEVIRVENESRLDSMRVGSVVGDQPSYNRSGFFNNFNRNKLGMTVNLHHPRGKLVAERLVQASDIVIENFSAGVFERLGFGWERLQELNPRISYITMSGFGQTGRNSHYVTWGPTAQAVSGITYMSGLPDQPPAGWGFSYLDHTGGYFGAIAALMALNYRAETGRGQYVDIAQVATGMTLAGVPMLDYQVNGREYRRTGNHSRWPAVAPHAVYRCKDSLEGEDRWIAIAAESEAQWRALCDVLGAAELLTDARFASNLTRVERQDALDACITGFTRRFDSRELMYLLQARGVPAGAAQNTRDKMEYDPQLEHRNFYVQAGHPELGRHRFEALPVHFSDAGSAAPQGAPCLGQHTQDVLTRVLGYSEAEVAELMAEAAV